MNTPNNSLTNSSVSSELALTKAAASLVSVVEMIERAGGTRQVAPKPLVPRRGYSRTEAAQYVGISETMFDSMVKSGDMPKPMRIGKRTIWDVQALDAAFDALAAVGNENPWDD